MIILASAFVGSYAKPAKSEWYILVLLTNINDTWN